MAFATTLVNRTSVPVPQARPSLIIRKALVTAGGLVGALTAGALAAFPGTASAKEPPSHTSLVASASQPLPTWCPFGTYGGKGGACRGGSATPNSITIRLVNQCFYSDGTPAPDSYCGNSGVPVLRNPNPLDPDNIRRPSTENPMPSAPAPDDPAL